MKLSELLRGADIVENHADMESEITGACCDSRKTEKGGLFVAVRGYESDGHRYIGAAVGLGAVCAVCEEKPDCGVPYVIVRDSRRAMAVIAANLYGRPAERMKMVAVTGTNGKTTVTTLVKQIIEKCTGEKAGLIGTNRNMIGSEELPAERTTPDAFELHKLLRRMADAGCRYAVMETSSHALYLDRVYGIEFEAGAFTNLTEDHLDFHKTMDEYAKAKAILFGQSRHAVLNLDDPYEGVMAAAAKGEIYTYSVGKNEADLTARDVRLSPEGVTFCAVTTGKLEKVRLGIPGMFSVYNALAALAVAVNLGLPLQDAVEALGECGRVKGRAEVVPTGRDFTLLIDYAHTPDALENILNTVKGFARGRTVLLFGCGGDREHAKRPLMGAIAAKMADYVYVTSDNPRTEEPEEIIRQILEGMKDTKTPYEVVPDRREAIGRAIAGAKPGDVVILAGKGHEDYQVIGKEKRHFDEREVAAEFLAR